MISSVLHRVTTHLTQQLVTVVPADGGQRAAPPPQRKRLFVWHLHSFHGLHGQRLNGACYIEGQTLLKRACSSARTSIYTVLTSMNISGLQAHNSDTVLPMDEKWIKAASLCGRRLHTGPIVLRTDMDAYLTVPLIYNSAWVITMKVYNGIAELGGLMRSYGTAQRF